MKKANIIKNIVKVIFVAYIFILMLVLIFKYPTGMLNTTIERLLKGETVERMAPQLIPFRTIILYAKSVHSLTDWFIKNLACNIIMFIPFGFLIPFFSKKSSCSIVAMGCFLSIAIELIQYFTALGRLDIDDVILNTAGTAIGCLLNYLCSLIHKYLIYRKNRQPSSQKQR
jgi:glycopeptide antibiotics resistance protein